MKQTHIPLKAALLLALFCPISNAQPQNFSDPVKLAEIALCDEQGHVAVGVLQGGKSRFAFLRRAGIGTAITTSADGLPNATPSTLAHEQLFEIGSVTKVFTGLFLAQAVEKGDLSLDDSLGKLLAGTVGFQSPAAGTITLRQLITHSSYLPRLPPGMAEFVSTADSYASLTRNKLWGDLANIKLESSPPCAAVYGSLGVTLVRVPKVPD